jgi:Helitron helicase-like domain at N-terminus
VLYLTHNQAAKKARAIGKSMQHHFGIPSVFLTVTFDDENSLLMQVMSGCTIDNYTDIQDLSDVELAERASRRKELRLKFPGLGAQSFEMQLQIVMEVVVG